MAKPAAAGFARGRLLGFTYLAATL